MSLRAVTERDPCEHGERRDRCSECRLAELEREKVLATIRVVLTARTMVVACPTTDVSWFLPRLREVVAQLDQAEKRLFHFLIR